MEDSVVLYIHGQGGSAKEAAHYAPLFPDCDVAGLDYSARTPWEAKEEFPKLFDSICTRDEAVTLIANSIGAYFSMHALSNKRIDKAFFISPIVDMNRLIKNMMGWAGVTEEELEEKKTIETSFGETLSYEYLNYVRENPIFWKKPTHILYGEKDNLQSFETIVFFSTKVGATLNVIENGEHYLHTEEEMKMIDEWIRLLK